MNLHPKDADEAARFGELCHLLVRQLDELREAQTAPDRPSDDASDYERRCYAEDRQRHYGTLEGLHRATLVILQVQTGLYAQLVKSGSR